MQVVGFARVLYPRPDHGPVVVTAPVQAIALARISDADWIIVGGRKVLDESATASQIADLLEYADEIGWTVGPAATHHVTEPDVSAYRVAMVTMPDGTKARRPRRPRFWEVLAMLRDGRADGLLFVDSDRGIGRHPRDLEDVIDAVELYHVPIRSMTGGDLNLNTPRGRAEARSKVAHDNASSADTSRRITRVRKRQALAGLKVGGPRRFGWQPGNTELRPEEAREIRNLADQVLAGVSLRQIAMDLRARGIPTAQGGQWEPTSVRGVLLNPAVMGRLVYRQAHPDGVPRPAASRLYKQEQITGPAPWPGIITEPEYWGIRDLLTDTNRRDSPGNTPRWLLSVLATCSECSGTFSVTRNRKKVPCYRCRECSAPPSRPAVLADRFVSVVITERLARPDAVDLLPPVAPDIDVRGLERQRAALSARKAAQARLHAEGKIDDDELTAGSAVFREQLAGIERQLGATRARSPLAGIAGRADAAEIWEAAPLGLKRSILRAATSGVIFRSSRAAGADTDWSLIEVRLRG